MERPWGQPFFWRWTSRRSTPVLRAIPAALFLLLPPATGSAQELPDTTQGTSTIRGRVLDRESGNPLRGALVRLPELELGRITNDQGWFEFLAVPLGSHVLTAEFMGYASGTDTLLLRQGELLDVTVSLAVDPIPLEGITVTARPRWLAATGFFRRQENANAYSGRQWTREEIEARNPVFVQDILTTAPGIQLRADQSGKSRLFGRRRCPLDVFVDGVFIPDFKMEALDPDWIEALEVYHGGSTFGPPEYSGRRCGVVLIWLNRGGGSHQPPEATLERRDPASDLSELLDANSLGRAGSQK